ncbi:class I SAM-dependent methyltransferase [Candidatus Woesearchaeota archaeon]|nr:class I SAM-dependent methyltransferase [Candidatus Woesearchaeota archaeon]
MGNSGKRNKDEWTSKVVNKCQICDSEKMESIIFLGYLPPVNQMHKIGDRPHEQPSYPAEILYCPKCHLVQLGLIVNPKILFPPEYPYRSSTTKILGENFAELAKECATIIDFKREDLIIDIGSNDGNLLSNFLGKLRVLGITPEEAGKKAIERGIPTIIDYFNGEVVEKVLSENKPAKIIMATNVFAHIDKVNDVVELILKLLKEDGVFISESHYLLSLIKTLQYDTIYHEHLRYYSLHSLKFLFENHGLEIIHAKEIPTHGGSIRVYAARKGKYTVRDTVNRMLQSEKDYATNKGNLIKFRNAVVNAKLGLLNLLYGLKKEGKRIYGIGAPSRAGTLINYTGIDEGVIDYVMEVKGSNKIGKYMPGTLIPVVEESRLYKDQPEFVILLSWHIAEELAPKISKKGYKGKFIVPLPEPHILEL